MTPTEKAEWLVCAESPTYFINEYCRIYDSEARAWIPFKLWPAQVRTLVTIHANQLVVVIKARQLGLSWLALGYALHQMIFAPIAAIGIFSRREEEATYLLGEERLRGMYSRLPDWMRPASEAADATKRWSLSNGSIARAFPTSAGDGYVFTLVIADEYDLVDDQAHLMQAVEPTINAGGKLLLISRVSKDRPMSLFKSIYHGAKAGLNKWVAVFLPWHVRPSRTAAWYEAQAADAMTNSGSLDPLWENYPATDAQALAPNALGKRIPPQNLLDNYSEGTPLDLTTLANAPALSYGLRIYEAPAGGRQYVIGADPAEGNPTSDDSAASVRDYEAGQQMAVLAGKFEPQEFAGYLCQLAGYYSSWHRGPAPVPAAVLVERNNHGHLVIAELKTLGARVMRGRDGKHGWLSNRPAKVAMYDHVAEAMRTLDAPTVDAQTWQQLTSIEGASLSAPPGQADDLAVADALALTARTLPLPASGGDDWSVLRAVLGARA